MKNTSAAPSSTPMMAAAYAHWSPARNVLLAAAVILLAYCG